MQETAQNRHTHKYNGGQAKRKGRSIKRQCATCLAWDKWRTYRAPRPDLTPPKKKVCTGFSTPPKPTTDPTYQQYVEEMNATGVVNIGDDRLAKFARDPNTGHPLADRPQPEDPLKDAAMSQRGAELLAMTVPELYKLAKDYGLKVTTKTKKADLIRAIDEHEIGSADD